MRHAIGPDIYGVTIFWNPSAANYTALRTFAQQIGLPANRYRGDETTRYNWNVDSSNAGSDWYFVAGNGQSASVPSGVDLASFWGLDDPSYPSAFAYQMFRNYDAHGAKFANGSVAATSSNPSALTIYAARRSSDGALTILVVNQTTSGLATHVALSHTYAQGTVLVYHYSQANPHAILAAPTLPLVHNLPVTFPAQSLTMLVVR